MLRLIRNSQSFMLANSQIADESPKLLETVDDSSESYTASMTPKISLALYLANHIVLRPYSMWKDVRPCSHHVFELK
jgi:hypothetical protein